MYRSKTVVTARVLLLLSFLTWCHFWLALEEPWYQGPGWQSPVAVALMSLGASLLLAFTAVMLQLKSMLAWIQLTNVLLTILFVFIMAVNFKVM